MANLKEIRSRISSVGSTMQITSAMKMVSAAKLKRAQDAVTQMRPYSNKLTELLVNLSSTLDSSEGGVYSENRDPKKILLVTITSNRGLCGGFNANIIKKAKYLMEVDYKNIETDILSIGKKSSEHFEKNGYSVISSHDGLYSDLTFENTSETAQIIMDSFTNKDYDKIILLYNQFKNAATQIVMNEQFLPIKSPEETETKVGDYYF
jgi:F-type H+-transporting ATPase subunit gamma